MKTIRNKFEKNKISGGSQQQVVQQIAIYLAGILGGGVVAYQLVQAIYNYINRGVVPNDNTAEARILNNPANRELIRSFLRRYGHTGRIIPVDDDSTIRDPYNNTLRSNESSLSSISTMVDDIESQRSASTTGTIGLGLKKPNNWINHVKSIQNKKGITYKEALVEASKTYK
jgi:hypothetical protein